MTFQAVKMDPSASRYLVQDDLSNPNPTNVRFNVYQVQDFQATPGMYGAAAFKDPYYVPFSNFYYKNEKDMPDIKNVTAIQDIKQIPLTTTVNAQIPEEIKTSQVGFGDNQINQDSDINLESLEKVPENVLLAFENPTIKVNTISFKPKDKKSNSQTGKGHLNVAQKTAFKKLPKSKMKFV